MPGPARNRGRSEPGLGNATSGHGLLPSRVLAPMPTLTFPGRSRRTRRDSTRCSRRSWSQKHLHSPKSETSGPIPGQPFFRPPPTSAPLRGLSNEQTPRHTKPTLWHRMWLWRRLPQFVLPFALQAVRQLALFETTCEHVGPSLLAQYMPRPDAPCAAHGSCTCSGCTPSLYRHAGLVLVQGRCSNRALARVLPPFCLPRVSLVTETHRKRDNPCRFQGQTR